MIVDMRGLHRLVLGVAMGVGCAALAVACDRGGATARPVAEASAVPSADVPIAQDTLDRPEPAPVPPLEPLTAEQAFFYLVSIYGTPDDVVERYGTRFDSAQYRRAMADEFERTDYVNKTRSEIESAARELSFDDRYYLVGPGALDEYDLNLKWFPINRVPSGEHCLSNQRTCYRGSVVYFAWQNAVNWHDFVWRLPMSEDSARAFIRRRTTADGISRDVWVRFVYSIVPRKTADLGHDWTAGRGFPEGVWLFPFIESVEVYADASLSDRLGMLPLDSTVSHASSGSVWRRGFEESQLSTGVIGTHRVITDYDPWNKVVQFTDVTITDAGLTWTAVDGRSAAFAFAEAFQTCRERDAHTSGNGPCIDHPLKMTVRRSDGPYTSYSSERYGIRWDGFTEGGSNGDRIQLAFETPRARGLFFRDLAAALRDWVQRFPMYAVVPLEVEELCSKFGRGPEPCDDGVPIG